MAPTVQATPPPHRQHNNNSSDNTRHPTNHLIIPTIPHFIQNIRSVKALADSGVQRIPDCFIKPQKERPGELDSANSHQIPVFDLSALHDQRRSDTVKEIGRACEEWGIFQVIKHGVPPSVLKSMREAAREFFHLPIEEKMLYYSTDPLHPVRFGSSFNPQHESVLEWRDVLRHMDITSPPDKNIDCWPKKPPTYRKAALDYIVEMKVLRDDILGAISEALGLESSHLQEVLQQQIFGLNYFPECPNPDLALGISPHSDGSGLSILLPDENVAGLQVLYQNQWVAVQPLPDAFVINVGDLLQIMTNGRYKSVEHRVVVNQTKERISIITLIMPLNDYVLAPIAKLLDKNNPPKYRTITCKDYMQKYLNKQHDGKGTLERLEIL